MSFPVANATVRANYRVASVDAFRAGPIAAGWLQSERDDCFSPAASVSED